MPVSRERGGPKGGDGRPRQGCVCALLRGEGQAQRGPPVRPERRQRSPEEGGRAQLGPVPAAQGLRAVPAEPLRREHGVPEEGLGDGSGRVPRPRQKKNRRQRRRARLSGISGRRRIRRSGLAARPPRLGGVPQRRRPAASAGSHGGRLPEQPECAEAGAAVPGSERAVHIVLRIDPPEGPGRSGGRIEEEADRRAGRRVPEAHRRSLRLTRDPTIRILLQ
mmetsp:Transcript_13732/g.40179  ORF Transcript_13732/g.40179 Transcript_13732/m.40179 type:complete len:221 (+) Transcript_13732:169-831(+)